MCIINIFITCAALPGLCELFHQRHSTMEEILALQRELAAVQMEDTSHRLNDRNIVEIVNKLVAMGKLEVIPTQSNTREYLTPKQLALEIGDELMAAGGRVSFEVLAPLLAVDISWVERVGKALAVEDEETDVLNGRELITTWYFDNLVDDINELVAEGGQLSVIDLASHFELPVHFVTRALAERFDSKTGVSAQLKGSMVSGVIYTKWWLNRRRARLRGLMNGVARPTKIDTLASKVADVVDGTTLRVLVKAMLADGEIFGTVKAGQYIPATFVHAQHAVLETFLKENGFVTLKRCKDMKVSAPLKFLRPKFPGCKILATCVISAVTKEDVSDVIDSVIADASWAHLPARLSAALGRTDLRQLVPMCSDDLGTWSAEAKRIRCKAVHVADEYVVAIALYKEVEALLAPIVERAAQAVVAPALAAAQAAAAAASGSVGGARGGEDDGGFVIVAHSDTMDDAAAAEMTRGGGGAKSRRKGGKKKGSGGGSGGGGRGKSGSTPSTLISRATLSATIAAILGEHMRRDLGYDARDAAAIEAAEEHEIGSAASVTEEHGGLVSAMARGFEPHITTLARASLHAANAAARAVSATIVTVGGVGGEMPVSGGGGGGRPKKLKQRDVEKSFVAAYELLLLHKKALAGFRRADPAPALVKFVAQTAGAAASRAFVTNVCLLTGVPAPTAVGGDGTYAAATIAECKAAIGRMPTEFKGLQPSLKALLKAWKVRSVFLFALFWNDAIQLTSFYFLFYFW